MKIMKDIEGFNGALSGRTCESPGFPFMEVEVAQPALQVEMAVLVHDTPRDTSSHYAKLEQALVVVGDKCNTFSNEQWCGQSTKSAHSCGERTP